MLHKYMHCNVLNCGFKATYIPAVYVAESTSQVHFNTLSQCISHSRLKKLCLEHSVKFIRNKYWTLAVDMAFYTLH